MSRMMRGAALAKFAEVANDLGLDSRAMLRRTGIDARILIDPELRAPADKVLELLEVSAKASGCETFGLRMALGRQLPDYGPISLLLAHQPTTRAALNVLIRYQRMLNPALVIHVEDHPGGVTVVREEFLSSSAGSLRQAYELAVGTIVQVFRGPTGPTLQ